MCGAMPLVRGRILAPCRQHLDREYSSAEGQARDMKGPTGRLPDSPTISPVELKGFWCVDVYSSATFCYFLDQQW